LPTPDGGSAGIGLVDEHTGTPSVIEPELILVGRVVERCERVKAGVEALDVGAAAGALDGPVDQISLVKWDVLIVRVIEGADRAALETAFGSPEEPARVGELDAVDRHGICGEGGIKTAERHDPSPDARA
jgi:hypothetical protein